MTQLVATDVPPPRPTVTSSATALNTSPQAPGRKPDRTRILKQALVAANSLESNPDLVRSLKKDLEKTRATALKSQDDVTYLTLELKSSKEKQESLQQALRESEQKARRHPTDSQARQRNEAAELETLKRCRQLEQELKHSQGVIENLKSELRVLSATRDQRICDLEEEKAALIGQSETLHNERNVKGRQELLIDAFNHRPDQVSEARIKSDVESLNDSLDTLVMEILDQGDQLAAKHSKVVCDSAHREYPTAPSSPLLDSLKQHDLTAENRGLLLDVLLHDQLNSELFEEFFRGDVASDRIDPHGTLQTAFEDMSEREPWSVVQRWRSISAASLSNIYNQPQFEDSFSKHAKTIVALLASAYGLTSTEYEPISDMIRSRLLAIHQEAKALCFLVRRDVISVRMSIITGHEARFDPDYADSLWPEMGAVKGDEVVGRYRFGLAKLDEGGRVSYLIKPEVATAALIRETSKKT